MQEDTNIVNLEELEDTLGVSFLDRELLRLALVHRSWLQTAGSCSNERLEFLGDAVLGITIADYLYGRYPDWTEGELTKLKAVAVSEVTLAKVARRLGLGRFLLLDRGMEQSGGRERSSLLSDALEALIAAVYLDQGLGAAQQFILRAMEPNLQAIERREHEQDYKTLLQEVVQEEHHHPPTYRLVDSSGPDHDKTFVVESRLGNRILGVGAGKSKKGAEQAAAKNALEQRGDREEPLSAPESAQEEEDEATTDSP